MSTPTRIYKNDEVVVEWRHELCIHCQECFQGLPQVFNPAARPWVNIDGAPSQDIVKQVQLCPSNALSIGK